MATFSKARHLCSSFVFRVPCPQSLLLEQWMPVRHRRVSCCFHIVTLSLPAAVAHMGKRAGRWDKPITPPVWGGLLPVRHAAAPVRALPGSFPMRACWNSQKWELCSLKSLQRGYILLGNLTWWPPGTILREETSNWASEEGKKVCGRLNIRQHSPNKTFFSSL